MRRATRLRRPSCAPSPSGPCRPDSGPATSRLGHDSGPTPRRFRPRSHPTPTNSSLSDIALLVLLPVSLLVTTAAAAAEPERLCQRNICLNGGTCVVRPDGSFGCRCPPGMGGLICEVDCGCVRGTCDAETQTCECQPGWVGEKCDIERSTISVSCQRDLDCPSDQRCLEDASGALLCQSDACRVTPCRNGGVCAFRKGVQSCECPLGFSGRLCGDDVNECAKSPCRNGGTCVNLLGGFRCDCVAPFSGDVCEHAGCEECGGGCVPVDGKFRCACSNGTIGRTCLPKNSSSPCGDCVNGGRCDAASHACVCHPDWTGAACERKLECRVKDRACENGSSCVRGVGGAFCECDPRHEGEWCERSKEDTTAADMCSGVRCANGGYCIVSNGSPKCACPASFTGTWCERPNDACERVECNNGGTCKPLPDHIEGGFECVCAAGFGGIYCDETTSDAVTYRTPSTIMDQVRTGPETTSSSSSTVTPAAATTASPTKTTTSPSSTSSSPLSTSPPPSPSSTSISRSSPSPTPSPASTTSQATPTSSRSTHAPPTSIQAPPTSTQAPSTSTPAITLVPVADKSLECSQCVHATRCVATSEGAACVCEDDFSGSVCDRPTKSCESLRCSAGEECIRQQSLTTHSLRCGCAIGTTGEGCKETSAYSFTAESVFVHQSPHVLIGSASGPLPYALAFAFRTTLPEVHLVSGDDIFGGRLFRLALEDDGRLAVEVAGSGRASNSIQLLPTPVNDGAWHIVHLNKTELGIVVTVREASGGRLLVARALSRAPSFDVFSTRLGRLSGSDHFVGCVADVVINGAQHDLAASSKAIGLKKGCTRSSPCASSPCHGGGVCVDLWSSFRCDCRPPLLPPLCEHALPPSTFGHGGAPSYAHVAIAPEVADKLKYTSSLSLLLRTKEKESVVASLGERVDGGSEAGEQATFISLQIVDGNLHARARVGRKSVVDVDTATRVDDNQEHVIVLRREKSRIAVVVDGIERGEAALDRRYDYPLFADSLLLGTANGSAPGAFTSTRHFKGSMQDIRVSGLSALLHPRSASAAGVRALGPLEHSENVLEGLVSDDICGSAKDPLCGAHGHCSNGFNDFVCVCDPGWSGSKCDFINRCSVKSCPEGATCYNTQDDFICVGPAHFVEASFASFELSSGSSSRVVERLSFAIRTHTQHAHVISLDTAYTIALVDGRLSVGISGSAFVAPIPVNNGQWTNVTINRNVLRVNNETFGLAPSTALSVRASVIRIGSLSSLYSFWGCVDSITTDVAEVPLSFFPRKSNESDVHDATRNASRDDSSSIWRATKRHRIDASGCRALPQCGLADACKHGGRCEDVWNARRCHCPVGFTGDRCEFESNECSQTPCVHGHCIDHPGHAECICLPGFTGAACDTPLADSAACSAAPCLNGGSCRAASPATAAVFICECPRGFAGRKCSIREDLECSEANCGNSGICSKNETIGFSCECVGGYSGERCEEAPDPCFVSAASAAEDSNFAPAPCGVHGHCRRDNGTAEGFSCECLEGYTGARCDSLVDLCDSSSCGGHGICSPGFGVAVCACSPPWTGRECRRRAGGCALAPCENDGACVEVEDGATTCKCPEYYLGDRCEVAGSCLERPCMHGTCRQRTPTAHSCECEAGWRGDKCEIEIDMCESSPCANGASCESRRGSFLCHCAPGFEGARCDVDIDECASSPCENGGKCSDSVGSFICLCPAAFTGAQCERDVDECKEVKGACQHGNCTNTHGAYLCECERGYLGARCAVRDPCIPDPATNRSTNTCVHGDCVRSRAREEGSREWAEHECACWRGYAGPTCGTKKEETHLSIGYVLGPAAAVSAVLALLGCALLCFVVRGKHAMHGHYSPSTQESVGARAHPMGTMLKLPPEERLI